MKHLYPIVFTIQNFYRCFLKYYNQYNAPISYTLVQQLFFSDVRDFSSCITVVNCVSIGNSVASDVNHNLNV